MISKNHLSRWTVWRFIAKNGLMIFLVGMAFGGGFIMRDVTQAPPQASAQTDAPMNFELLQQVHMLVSQNYVRELPDQTALEYSAIRGYLSTLNDPYTFFNDPPVTSSESDALAGRYGGIGVIVNRNEAGLIELFPYPDSPAARAGILDGDILVAINDVPIDINERLDVIRQMTRGEIKDGAGVRITVRRPDSEEKRTYDILFEEIRVPSVIWRVLQEDASIGYVQITNFTALTPEEFQQAMANLNAANVTALILDLRNNPGGLLKESIDIADEFLNSGTILIEESRASGRVLSEATAGGTATDLPVVVLTNRGTASAAEVVAGAIQANQRGILIGQRTLGKGSVQFIFRLNDGSSIHITASLWLTPTEAPLDGIGLVPNIEMIPDENNRDVELGEAIRQVQGMRTDSN